MNYAGRLDRLNGRQAQVMLLIERGMKSPQIGAELGISRHTVNKYVQEIYDIFAIGSRSQIGSLVNMYSRVIREKAETGKPAANRKEPEHDVKA